MTPLRLDRVHWVERGEGPPLIFLHGAFTTHADWPEAIVEPLAQSNRVFLLDRPGHGFSPRARHAADARLQAEQIYDALHARLEQPPIVVAHSFGALTALCLAEQFPERIAGLVLIAPACFAEVRPVEHLYLAPRATPLLGPLLSSLANRSLDPPFLNYIHRMMFAPQPVPDSWKRNYPISEIMASEAFVVEGEDALAVSPVAPGAYRRLEKLALPVSVLMGRDDKIVWHALHGLMLATLLPNTRQVWLSGIGHMLHHARPDVVVREVRALPRAKS